MPLSADLVRDLDLVSLAEILEDDETVVNASAKRAPPRAPDADLVAAVASPRITAALGAILQPHQHALSTAPLDLSTALSICPQPPAAIASSSFACTTMLICPPHLSLLPPALSLATPLGATGAVLNAAAGQATAADGAAADDALLPSLRLATSLLRLHPTWLCASESNHDLPRPSSSLPLTFHDLPRPFADLPRPAMACHARLGGSARARRRSARCGRSRRRPLLRRAPRTPSAATPASGFSGSCCR